MSRCVLRGLCASLILTTGCLTPVPEKIDATVCDLGLPSRDLQPLAHAAGRAGSFSDRSDEKKGPRLTVPDALLPGGPVPPIRLPRARDDDDPARRAALDKLYPPLPAPGDDADDPPGPAGAPLTLSDLQRLAATNSPALRQAAARVEEARGAALQAGLPPNPTLGYEGDTLGTTGGAGYQGGFIEQTLKTANKLQLARAAATMELHNAELALTAAHAELTTRVRGGYFAVLTAQESVRLNRALVAFSQSVYRVQVEQVRKGGFAAPYEPMYLRALATQARVGLIQARNRRTAAWKQLAATLGLPGLPPAQLAGRLDIAVPAFAYADVLAQVLARHTDVRTAANELQQARYRLELARVTPVPDINVRVMVQKDRTAPPFNLSPSVAVSVPVPIYDRNQGNIHQAQAAVERASEEAHRARNELTRRLATAFEAYENGRAQLALYRDSILPDLVRVYRGVYERYQTELPGPGASPPALSDVVVAQQNLAQAVTTYLTALGQQWQAVVDVADLLQTGDLFGVAPTEEVAAVPELEALCALPCCHGCSPLAGAHQAPPDGSWPPADAEGAAAAIRVLPPPGAARPGG